MTKPIQVWRFHDAPAELRALSDHGGDEDWLALIPEYFVGEAWVDAAMSDEYPHPHNMAMQEFGCSSISIHELPDGSQVRIGAHA